MFFRLPVAVFLGLAACQRSPTTSPSHPEEGKAVGTATPASRPMAAPSSDLQSAERTKLARHPVRWEAELELETLAGLGEVMRAKEQEPLVSLAILDDHKEPLSCKEWQRLRHQGYAPMNTLEAQNDGFSLYRCGTLAWLSRARPATTSYLDHISWDRNVLKLLPPTLGSAMDDAMADAADEAAASGQSWADFDPKAKAKKAAGSVGVDVTEGKGKGVTRLRPTAWGDFNQDSLADVVVFVVSADRLGPYADHRLVLMTRRTADGPLELVETWSP